MDVGGTEGLSTERGEQLSRGARFGNLVRRLDDSLKLVAAAVVGDETASQVVLGDPRMEVRILTDPVALPHIQHGPGQGGPVGGPNAAREDEDVAGLVVAP